MTISSNLATHKIERLDDLILDIKCHDIGYTEKCHDIGYRYNQDERQELRKEPVGRLE